MRGIQKLSIARLRLALATFVGLAGAAMLAGCAVTTPVAITSTDGSLGPGSSVRLVPFESDGSLRSAFGPAVLEAFAAHNVTVQSGTSAIADFGIGVRPADTGVANPEASSEEAIVWESLPSESRWYDECSAKRLRATLVILSSADSSILYRGVAESDVCEYSQADFRALADALVANAL